MTDLFSREFVVKICGVTTAADARHAAGAGADAIGAIVCSSPRRVDVRQARTVFDAAGVTSVAVARADEPESLDAAFDAVSDVVQIHGPIPSDYLSRLRARGTRVIQAVGVEDDVFLTFDDGPVDATLVDGATPGSGRSHSFLPLLSRPFRRPVVAAGGLTPESVAKVVERFDVWGVDVATGVERSPGVKDPDRVVAFIEAARSGYAIREAERG